MQQTVEKTIDIEVNVREHVLKPLGEVFDAFIDPAKMANYFISGASGPMTVGKQIEWAFADVGARIGLNTTHGRVSHRWRVRPAPSTAKPR